MLWHGVKEIKIIAHFSVLIYFWNFLSINFTLLGENKTLTLNTNMMSKNFGRCIIFERLLFICKYLNYYK